MESVREKARKFLLIVYETSVDAACKAEKRSIPPKAAVEVEVRAQALAWLKHVSIFQHAQKVDARGNLEEA